MGRARVVLGLIGRCASRFVAVSNTYSETSADGLAWTVLPSPDCGNGVLWDGEALRVGGRVNLQVAVTRSITPSDFQWEAS